MFWCNLPRLWKLPVEIPYEFPVPRKILRHRSSSQTKCIVRLRIESICLLISPWELFTLQNYPCIWYCDGNPWHIFCCYYLDTCNFQGYYHNFSNCNDVMITREPTNHNPPPTHPKEKGTTEEWRWDLSLAKHIVWSKHDCFAHQTKMLLLTRSRAHFLGWPWLA